MNLELQVLETEKEAPYKPAYLIISHPIHIIIFTRNFSISFQDKSFYVYTDNYLTS